MASHRRSRRGHRRKGTSLKWSERKTPNTVSPNADRSLAHPPRQAPVSPHNHFVEIKHKRKHPGYLFSPDSRHASEKQALCSWRKRLPSLRSRQAPHRPGMSQEEKAVQNAKKAVDTESYKLYYVNYEIGDTQPSHSPSPTKDLTKVAGTLPRCSPARCIGWPTHGKRSLNLQSRQR